MSLSRNTSYNLIGAVLPLLLSLLTVPLYLRLVGIERYGVLQIAWLLLGYFGLFDLGLGRATSFRIAALREASGQERADTFWSALVVNLAMGLVGGAILWAVARYFFVDHAKVSAVMRAETLAAIPLLALSVPIATLTGVLTGALQGREKFFETNSISVTSTALFQLLPLTIAWGYKPYLPFLLAAALSARAIGLVALATRCWCELTAGQTVRVRTSQMVELLSYGGWVTLTAVFGPMLVIADRFAMSATLGMAAVAIYSIPYNLASRIAVLPAALTNALFPRLSGASAAEAQVLGSSVTRTVLAMVSLPILCAILGAGLFLHTWVGAKLALAAAPIARILILSFWFNALALVSFTRLQAKGRPDLVTKILLLQIPPYWAALYLGMTRLGLIGCALAFLGRMALDYTLQSWVSDRAFNAGRTVFSHFMLLVAALTWSQWLDYHAPLWGLGALVLVGLSLRLSWPDIPEAVRRRILPARFQLSAPA